MSIWFSPWWSWISPPKLQGSLQLSLSFICFTLVMMPLHSNATITMTHVFWDLNTDYHQCFICWAISSAPLILYIVVRVNFFQIKNQIISLTFLKFFHGPPIFYDKIHHIQTYKIQPHLAKTITIFLTVYISLIFGHTAFLSFMCVKITTDSEPLAFLSLHLDGLSILEGQISFSSHWYY